MTWAEIEQRIARGGLTLTQEEIDNLWDCLFLDTKRIEELLGDVKEHAAHPFIYPMFVFVAHTGARRSEMMRSEVDDLDFQAGEVVLREKKKNRSKKVTFRRVPMSDLFRRVLKEWLANDHPGGRYTFCVGEMVARSKKRSKTTGHQSGLERAKSLKGRMATVREREQRPGLEPLTKKEAYDHFKRTLAGSKWEVVRGFHVFRHSFASNCAAKGVRPDVIDRWMGHQTEEMRRRYRHLFPQETQDALRKVFG
jgi:integrase